MKTNQPGIWKKLLCDLRQLSPAATSPWSGDSWIGHRQKNPDIQDSACNMHRHTHCRRWTVKRESNIETHAEKLKIKNRIFMKKTSYWQPGHSMTNVRLTYHTQLFSTFKWPLDTQYHNRKLPCIKIKPSTSPSLRWELFSQLLRHGSCVRTQRMKHYQLLITNHLIPNLKLVQTGHKQLLFSSGNDCYPSLSSLKPYYRNHPHSKKNIRLSRHYKTDQGQLSSLFLELLDQYSNSPFKLFPRQSNTQILAFLWLFWNLFSPQIQQQKWLGFSSSARSKRRNTENNISQQDQ